MQKNSKRHDILREGRRLLHAQGYGATGVSAVVEAAGVPKGSFYNHFLSKDDFASSVLDAYFEDVLQTLRSGVQGRSALERAQTYFQTLRDLNARAQFAEGCLIGNMAGEVGALAEPLRYRLAAMFDTWSDEIAERIICAGQDGADRESAAIKAALLLDAWQGAVLRSKVEKSDAALERFLGALLPAILGRDA